ncbi:MAG: 30S ribosomal protein S3, partial [Bacteroidales bacterium]|nr:30S ribosomal protein S3 [Bacteroidales bacterium]
LRADIEYAKDTAHTTYGCIGLKVWVCKGIVYGKRDLFSVNEGGKEQKSGMRRTARPNDRRRTEKR